MFCNSDFGVSPFLQPFLPAFFGKIISLDIYILRRFTFACKLSAQRFRRRWSTAMPIVGAFLIGILASRSSSRVKPLPNRSFMLYLWVGGCTIGRNRPAAGRG